LDKALWRPTRHSLARAWVVGVPISMFPFLPFQSVFAIVLGFVFRANLLLCILLQFVSSPITAPIQLPACFFVGELVRGRTPAAVWTEFSGDPRAYMMHGDRVVSLYLGAVVLGIVLALLGYFIILGAVTDPKLRAAKPGGASGGEGI
jgi:uncharacterized protein (DUF2062 family)